MSATPVAQRMTADEYLNCPDLEGLRTDLVEGEVVVSSPAWRHQLIGPKKSGYERTGLPELWLVDTAADVVLVFRRSSPRRRRFDVVLELDRDAELTSPLLPGFSLSLAALFSAG